MLLLPVHEYVHLDFSLLQISPKDAKSLDIQDNANVKLTVNDESVMLKAIIDEDIENGTVAVPINRRGVNHFARYLNGKIEKVSEGEMFNVN